MNHIFEFVKFLKDPHSKKIQQHKERYQELDELSNVAVDIQDEAAFKSLQVEMREVFFDYLTAVAIDSIYKLFPHIIIICLIGLKFKVVNIPILNWQVNIIFAYLAMYFLVQVRKPVINAMTRLKKVGMSVLQWY